MEQQQVIEEGNLLIANFMGVKIGEDKYSWRPGCIEPLQSCHLAYHKEWGWLMPVVEKIRNDHYFEVEFYGDYTRANVVYETGVEGFSLSKWLKECSSIEVVWLVIVQFITWYNTQNK